jgi:type III pantothenate kinase
MQHTGLLAIDIGNTNVKCGLWDGSAWERVWRAQSLPDNLADDYAVFVLDFVRDESLRGMAISSVVPSLTTAFMELGRRHLRLEPFLISAKLKTGLHIALDQPEQVGADRLANAAAVAALYGSPAIAVDLGTATKFEVVGRGGVYQGGAIAPGITLARDALVSRAPILPQVEIAPPPHPIGTNTSDAVQSGTFWGYVSLVEAMITRIKRALGEEDVPVVATGGLTPLIRPHVPLINMYVEELTLNGIRIIYEFNPEYSERACNFWV